MVYTYRLYIYTIYYSFFDFPFQKRYMTGEFLNISVRSYVSFSHIHTWWLISVYVISPLNKMYNLQKSSPVTDLLKLHGRLPIESWNKFKITVLGFLDSSNSWSSPPHYILNWKNVLWLDETKIAKKLSPSVVVGFVLFFCFFWV